MMKIKFFIIMLALFQAQNGYAKMQIIGHRGACGYEPENTLISFQRALDMGVDMIELDIYVCATGELIVMHDDDVDRTTNGHGNVIDMTFQELRSLIVEGKEQIPTLQEVVELVNRQIPINIELKGPNTAKSVAEMIEKYVAKGWSYNDFVASSFDHHEVGKFKQLCPSVQIGVLFEGSTPQDIADMAPGIALEYQASFIGVDNECMNQKIVDNAHDKNLQVLVFTINDVQRAKYLNEMGVDGIFSNYPDKMK